jgi:dTDP-4-dehydrorhamnose reductase
MFRRRVVLLQIIGHFSYPNVYTSSKTTGERLVASGCVVRIIVKVGLLPTKKGESLMLTAKNEEISAISNLCSTVDQVVRTEKSLHAAFHTPIKDRP